LFITILFIEEYAFIIATMMEKEEEFVGEGKEGRSGRVFLQGCKEGKKRTVPIRKKRQKLIRICTSLL